MVPLLSQEVKMYFKSCNSFLSPGYLTHIPQRLSKSLLRLQWFTNARKRSFLLCVGRNSVTIWEWAELRHESWGWSGLS
jgi:hypothetical protein